MLDSYTVLLSEAFLLKTPVVLALKGRYTENVLKACSTDRLSSLISSLLRPQ